MIQHKVNSNIQVVDEVFLDEHETISGFCSI